MRSDLRFRQIHLDFHTSEAIPDVGAQFNPDQFVGVLKKARVNSVTVFARDHHGWCFYPSSVGKPHPNLQRPDLLGEMVTACRADDINVVIYHTVQWDERMAREHPEWRVIDAHNHAVFPNDGDASALNQLSATWHSLCVGNKRYVDYVQELALEVVEHYQPDGIFLDILIQWECVCTKCIERMVSRGLDPSRSADRLQNARELIMEYYEQVSSAIWRISPDMRVYHNSGHIFRGERDRYRWFSHLEIESLPTGGWGYDHFPLSARYAATLGLEYLGMTGKFHTMWGEFGGYKRPVALDYECAAMAAYGARCSIGDQLHPSGLLDEATYQTIEPAYRRIERMEPFLVGARPVSEIAILSSEAHGATNRGRRIDHTERVDESDAGASRMLLELHCMFDVVDLEADFERYRLLVLPDTITLDSALSDRLDSYVKRGGRLLLTGASGLTEDRTRFALRLPLVYDGAMSTFWPDYIEPLVQLDPDLVSSPFVSYERSYRVRGGEGSEVLAATRIPYFNRSYRHFSSHQHAPPRLERNPEYDAVIQAGTVVYVSNPLFRAYFHSGQPLLKYLVRGTLERLLPDRGLRVSLPSDGRVSLMEQPAANRLILHLLFAHTQLRGAGMPYPDGRVLPIEVIEDAVPIRDVRCEVRLAGLPKEIYLGSSGTPLRFEYSGGKASFVVPEVDLHEMVVIER